MNKQLKFNTTTLDAVQDRDGKKRTMTFEVSNEKVNRYGHLIRVAGWDIKNFLKNPVVLANHNSMDIPVAKASRVWKDNKNKKLMATVQFPKEGELPYSDLFYKLYDNNLMNAVSPGYLVDFEKAEYPKDEKGPNVVFNKQELIEISFATLPANPDALRKQSFIKEAFDLEIIDDDFIERCYSQLKDIKVEEDTVEKEEIIEDTVVEDTEDIDVEIDYLDKDVQTETLDEADDPYADFYKALDEINQEQKDDDDPDILAGKVIESIESVDSKDDSEDDLDSLVGQVLNQ